MVGWQLLWNRSEIAYGTAKWRQYQPVFLAQSWVHSQPPVSCPPPPQSAEQTSPGRNLPGREEKSFRSWGHGSLIGRGPYSQKRVHGKGPILAWGNYRILWYLVPALMQPHRLCWLKFKKAVLVLHPLQLRNLRIQLEIQKYVLDSRQLKYLIPGQYHSCLLLGRS